MVKKAALNLVLFIFMFTAAFPQDQPDNTTEGKSFYLFRGFEPARILMKSGAEKEVEFNYNVVTEEMIFSLEGRLQALDMEGIDTIFIAGKKFIPFGKIFFEVSEYPAGLLYIRHQKKPMSRGKAVGYGGYSLGAATTSFSGHNQDRTYFALKVQDEYELKDITSFLIRRGKQFHKVNSARQMIKAFPDKKDTVQAFVKEHKTDFNNPKDVMKLLEELE